MLRLRVTFAKTEAMRFIGHLDLHKAWERMLRRADLPLAYTQGFSPHPRINLASALPLGFTGEAEIIDIYLDSDLPIADIETSLSKAAPPGIELVNVESVDLKLPTLQVILASSEFFITFRDPIPDLAGKISELLLSEHLPRERRGKPYDLRPLLLELEPLPDSASGQKCARVVLTALPAATGRPEEVIEALGVKPEAVRVHRRRLIFSEAPSKNTHHQQYSTTETATNL